jgi:hypothetical protein
MSLRHERRRRLLTDDSDESALADAAVRLAPRSEGAADAPAAAYTEGGKLACGRPVAALVPSRLVSIACTALVALALVGACLGLHTASAALAERMPGIDLAALRLGASGSLDGWLASTLLVVAAALCLFLYSLRRHRLDDYHGRYRVWLSSAVACLLVSAIESSAIGRLARGLSDVAGAWTGVRAAALWSAGLAVLASLVGLRLLLEVRRCRPAVASLAACGLVFVLAAIATGAWPLDLGDGRILWARGAWLTGYVLVLTTLLLYGRHVQLDVAGKLPHRKRAPRPAKPRREKAPADAEAQPKHALRLRTDLDPVEKPAPAAARPAPPAAASPPSHQLSRAERRRLRRMAG